MARFDRNPLALTKPTYDLLIVGGGIYGATLALEASLRGYKALLMEKGDFGGATSWNSLRIIHGGLRYLQNLNLHRFRESVSERRWFLRHFPDLVRPLPCLIPLYNEGMHRKSIFGLAIAINACLSFTRNRGIRADRRIERGGLVSVSKTISSFPKVDKEGLCGAAVWYDGVMVNSPRVLIEILRWACEYGASVLNYLEAKELIVENRRVMGVTALDQTSGSKFQYNSPIVVNCAGPWCREVARTMDRDVPVLFKSSLAFNIVLNREPISDYAIAVAPRNPKGKAYFVLPFNNRIFAGTYHIPWTTRKVENPQPEKSDLISFLNELNRAIPGLELNLGDISRVLPGVLPAEERSPDTPAHREVIVNHRDNGGPDGLYSVSGVKFTTARLVAEKTLRRIYPKTERKDPYSSKTPRPPPNTYPRFDGFANGVTQLSTIEVNKLKQLLQEESVLHLDDLMLRRTDWTFEERYSSGVAEKIYNLFEWNNTTLQEELNRLKYSFFNMTDYD